MKSITLEILNSFKILRAIFLCLNLFCVEFVSGSSPELDTTADKLDPNYLENFEREQREKALRDPEHKFDSNFQENLKQKEELEANIKGEYDSIYLENEKRKEEQKDVPQGEISKGEETGGLLKSSILLFGVTFAGILIAKSCLKKASSVTFLAAATLYITAEITLFTKFYQDGNKELKAYQENKYDKRQVGSLEEASKRANSAAKAALAKSIIQAAAAAGFIAASVIAIIEAALDFPKFTGDCFSTGVFPETKIQLLAQSLLKALIPNTNAKVEFGTIGPMLAGIGVGAAAAVAISSAMSGALGSSMAGALGSGYTRGAVFAVFGGFATWSATEAGIAYNKLKKNSSEYKRLAGEASRLKKKGQIIISEDEEIYTREKQSVENISTGVGGSKEEFSSNTCLEGNNIAEDAKADKDCSCRATNTCTKVKLPDLEQDRPDFPGGDTLADAASAFAKSADAVFSGDLSKAQIEGKNAQRLAARLKTYNPDYIDLANKKIVASGGKPLEDWDKLEAKTEKFLVDKVSSSLGSLSSKDRSALAELVPDLGRDKSSQKDASKPVVAALKNRGEGIIDLNINSDTEAIKTGFEFLDEEENEERLLLDQSEVQSRKLKGKSSKLSKGLGKSDEISGRNKDLFKIVTKRYHSSAYQSFFGRKASAP